MPQKGKRFSANAVPSVVALPSGLEDVLRVDKRLLGAVQCTLSDFAELLASTPLVFFPDFTDHGTQHVADVLTASESFISKSSFDLLTPADSAVLICASLLHDAAMHLTPDGFLALVDGEYRSPSQTGFADEPWPQLWEQFKMESARFSGRQNSQLFGTPEPVSAPGRAHGSWTADQFRLIGEFVRRHHARLAHEMALSGVPGVSSARSLKIDSHLGELANIAGIVARSHGLPLRASADILHMQYQNRVAPLSTHPVFLMAVLRIADYFQIHASRAPEIRLRVQSLRSPISVREWKRHSAVLGLSISADDPEALHILTKPLDAETFIGLEELFTDIQNELDTAWAVLGETFGLQSSTGLDRFALTVRRIKHNLDDVVLRSSLSYVPVRAAFATAGADFLNLLVGPLYGQKPELGVRELLQNSVDAVRELNQYCRQASVTVSNLDRPDQPADVLIELQAAPNGEYWLTVSDKGIGMSVDTVVNYFLRAGASFRDTVMFGGRRSSTRIENPRFFEAVVSALVRSQVFYSAIGYASPRGTLNPRMESSSRQPWTPTPLSYGFAIGQSGLQFG